MMEPGLKLSVKTVFPLQRAFSLQTEACKVYISLAFICKIAMAVSTYIFSLGYEFQV